MWEVDSLDANFIQQAVDSVMIPGILIHVRKVKVWPRSNDQTASLLIPRSLVVCTTQSSPHRWKDATKVSWFDVWRVAISSKIFEKEIYL